MATEEYQSTYKDILNPISSRYSNTAIFEDSGEVFRGTYNKIRIEPSSEDKIILVRSEEAGRPDLIALRYYGNPKLYWVIAEANKLMDPINEIVAGMELLIPPERNVTA